MRSMRRLRAAAVVVACSAVVGLFSAGPAQAGPAQAGPAQAGPAQAVGVPVAPSAAGTCRITVTNTDGVSGDEVQALELQEGGNGDEIFIRLNGQRFPASGTVGFSFAGQGRPASAFGFPTAVYTGSVRVELIEKDLLFNDEIGDVFLGCGTFSGTLQLINGGTGAYNIEILIQPI